MKPLQSVKKWQRTFFYVRNPNLDRDGLNLPEFELAPPTTMQNWEVNAGAGVIEIDNMFARIRHL